MRYPCYSLAQGRQVLTALRSEYGSPQVRNQAELRHLEGGLANFEIDDVLRILERRISPETAEKLHSDGMGKDEIEASLAVELYAELYQLHGQVLSDPDFWRFIAIEVLRTFVIWRDGENCTPASFGLNSSRRIPDCVPLRMFNRVHIAHKALGVSDTTRVLEFSKSAGTDFWQSHVFRVKNRFDPLVVQRLVAAANSGEIQSVAVMREVAKSIKQFRANLNFRWLDQPSLDQLLASAISEAKELVVSRSSEDSTDD